MALTPQDNTGFLREVDEEVRRDQAAEFWKRWGLWIAIGVVLVLAAVGGWMWWQNHKQAQAEAETEQLNTVLDDLGQGGSEDVDARLEELMQSDRPGIRAAAIFTRAGHAADTGDYDKAADLFGQAAGDEGLPPPYRDLALIRQVSLQFDDLDPAQVIEALADLAKPESPWFGSAGELTALALMKQGKNDRAGQLFAQIAHQEDLPQSLRSRATQMAGVLGVDAVPDEPVEIDEQAAAQAAQAAGQVQQEEAE